MFSEVHPVPKPARPAEKKPSGFSHDIVEALQKEFGGRCLLSTWPERCQGRHEESHHCFPRKIGGSRRLDEWWNAAPLCKPCHLRAERDRALRESLREWALERRSLHLRGEAPLMPSAPEPRQAQPPAARRTVTLQVTVRAPSIKSAVRLVSRVLRKTGVAVEEVTGADV